MKKLINDPAGVVPDMLRGSRSPTPASRYSVTASSRGPTPTACETAARWP